jgi:hypothetical protein
MKKLFVLLILGICVQAFAQAFPIKVVSYLIGRKETAAQYDRGELQINDETQSWEIVLYKKTGANREEKIVLKTFSELGGGIAVFRNITITEAGKNTGSDLFAYIPNFDPAKLQIDLCDNKTERTKRRLVISVL